MRKPLEDFSFSSPPTDPIELYNTLGTKLKELGGIGLAANQLGLPYRAFVVRSDPILGFFNPYLVDTSDEVISMEEGCLTYPGFFVKVKRPRVIKVRFADPTGDIKTAKFQDMTARVIQHELDHLNGITLGQRIGRMSLEMAIKKAKAKGFHYTVKDFL